MPDDQRNDLESMVDAIFSDELGRLMMISYIVLGNNVVTNRFIEKTYRMPVQAWSSLYAVVRFPGIRAKEIKNLFPRPQNTISRALALLESRGLVCQIISPTDGREKRVFATETGRNLLAEIKAISIARQEELFEPLTKAEQAVFFELARKIADGPRLQTSQVMCVE